MPMASNNVSSWEQWLGGQKASLPEPLSNTGEYPYWRGIRRQGGIPLVMSEADLETKTTEMEEIAQYLERLLYTTEGALSLENCFFVAMTGYSKMTNNDLDR